MRAAFVFLAASGPGSMPDQIIASLDNRRPPVELPFDVASHLSWSNGDGSVAVGAWSELVAGDPDWAWSSDGGGLSVVTSPVRRCGSGWPPSRKWPDLLATSLRPFTTEALDKLAGEFSGLVLDPSGRGVGVTDAFAHRGLYLANGSSHAVVASTAALAAWAIEGEISRTPRDPWGVCGLAYTKHRIGERTGFAGVQSLPIGSYVELASPRGVTVAPRQPPWVPDRELDGLSEQELLDVAHSALEDAIRAASECPARTRFMDLTGGKDSRLLLALAMTARVSDQFVFRTQGPPTLLDVAIAQELAALADVRWTDSRGLMAFRREHGDAVATTDQRTRSTPWNERMRNFVRSTAGICNISDTSGLTAEPLATADGLVPLQVNGLAGELLRSTVGFEIPDQTALVRRFDRHFGHLDLLKPDALRHYRAEWVDDVLREAHADGTWNDRHDAFLLRSQVRSNFGPKLELTATRKLMPLSSVRAVRAAYAMGGEARVAERVHRELVGRASPALEHHRFTKDDWHVCRETPEWARPTRRVFHRHRERDLYDAPLDRPNVRPAMKVSPSLSAADYMGAAAGYEEQVELMRELTAERSNPAWDLIDVAAVAAAVDRYEQLPRAAHVELMGAATAAIWLATS